MPTTLHHHLRLGLLPLLAALAGCSNFVEGNGVYAVRVLDASTGLSEFTSAVVGFPGDVDVSGHPPSASIYCEAQARRVELSGDENVIEHIKVAVDASGRLVTTIDVDGYSSVHPLWLRVDAPDLQEVEATAGSYVSVDDAPADAFSVLASARGHVVLRGAGGGQLNAALVGGAQLTASAFPVSSANLTLAGASTATVWPEQAVSGTAAEGSCVWVKGSAGCTMTLADGSTCAPLE